MTGYKTLIVMFLGLVFAGMQMFGVVVAQDDQSAIATGVLAIAGIILRLVTNTTAGKTTSPAPMPPGPGA